MAGLAEADADRFAGELGDLPLAVAQAPGFMADTGTSRRVPGTAADAGRAASGPGRAGSSYPRSLAAATQLREPARREDPAAAQLASVCAFLAPDPIPEDLFTGAPGELPGELAGRAAIRWPGGRPWPTWPGSR